MFYKMLLELRGIQLGQNFDGSPKVHPQYAFESHGPWVLSGAGEGKVGSAETPPLCTVGHPPVSGASRLVTIGPSPPVMD